MPPTAQDSPDFFQGKAYVSVVEPYAQITSSGFTSVAPGSIVYVGWIQPDNAAINHVQMFGSMSIGVPGATSQSSTGSEGFSYAISAALYRRQLFKADRAYRALDLSETRKEYAVRKASRGIAHHKLLMTDGWKTYDDSRHRAVVWIVLRLGLSKSLSGLPQL